jgi:hypothetical protein
LPPGKEIRVPLEHGDLLTDPAAMICVKCGALGRVDKQGVVKLVDENKRSANMDALMREAIK